jgi:hypothetical protein
MSQRVLQTFCVVLAVIFSIPAFSALSDDSYDEESPPFWEYGIGVGTVHFEEYPAAGQYRDFFLPFPTFQYRGKVLRADDRDGAHLYLLKEKNWYLEFSGTGYPSLESTNSKERSGMPDLPWMLAIGPQLVYRLEVDSTLSFAVFQAVSSDFKMTKQNGEIFQLKLNHRFTFPFDGTWVFEDGHTFGNVFLTLKSATKEFLTTYFEVSDEVATIQRPRYDAQSGLLSGDLSYFQSFKSGRAAFYVGAAYSYYGLSSNRTSPLHKSDSAVTYLVGVTYVLGGSSKPEVPEEDTSGIIDKYKPMLPFF